MSNNSGPIIPKLMPVDGPCQLDLLERVTDDSTMGDGDVAAPERG